MKTLNFINRRIPNSSLGIQRSAGGFPTNNFFTRRGELKTNIPAYLTPFVPTLLNVKRMNSHLLDDSFIDLNELKFELKDMLPTYRDIDIQILMSDLLFSQVPTSTIEKATKLISPIRIANKKLRK